MPGKTRSENTYLEMKQSKRWEKKYPDLRCVKCEDPELHKTDIARQAVNRLQMLGYRVIPMTTEERLEMLDCDDFMLMGCSLERWKENKESLREMSAIPDSTEELIG